jgi:hypothetical protein
MAPPGLRETVGATRRRDGTILTMADDVTPRPLIAVDVDGVLYPNHSDQLPDLGYQPRQIDTTDHHGQPVTGQIWLHPDHGTWLNELAEYGDLLWSTSWQQRAQTDLAPLLGLPTGLPYLPNPTPDRAWRVTWGYSDKIRDLIGYAEGRPLVVFDDDFGGKDDNTAEHRNSRGLPTLFVPVDPYLGLQREHIDTAEAWLRTVTGRS